MRLKIIVLLVLAGVMCALLGLHVRYVNGSDYWVWQWRDTSALSKTWWFGWMLLAAAPIVVAAMCRAPAWLIIALCMAGVIAMKLLSLAALTRPLSFDAVETIVRHPWTTSYYNDAAAITSVQPSGWLADYPIILPHTNLHTQSKPPGPVAYWAACIRLFGYGRAATIAGAIGLAIFASLAVPATWWLARLLTGQRELSLLAATMLAVCPGFVLVFPTFDAGFVVFTAGLIGLWHLAVTRNDLRLAAAFGVVLGITCFFTYNLLVLGVFLAIWPLLALQMPLRAKLLRMARLSALAIAGVAAFYVVLAIFTSFDPIATFRTAWRNQHALLEAHAGDRPWPQTVPLDLLDFALGAGWLPVVLTVMYLLGTFRSDDPRMRGLTLLCLAQPVIVAVVGILQLETARVWSFMLPLLLLPAAEELSRWPPRWRALSIVAMLAITLTVGYHMVFMIVSP
jgi:hypothetical protein